MKRTVCKYVQYRSILTKIYDEHIASEHSFFMHTSFKLNVEPFSNDFLGL